MKSFFQALTIPVNEITLNSTDAKTMLKEIYNPDNEAFKLIDKVYPYATVSQNAFDNLKESFSNQNMPEKYLGILLFGIELNENIKGQKPSRTILAEITRAFNRKYQTPVTIIFKYSNFITLASSQRLEYKQDWREGERIGKITMLKDIDIINTHSAHERIIESLKINTSVNSFDSLYKFWNEKLSVQALNEQFYKDLQDWFYYAITKIELPYTPEYLDKDENKKNFLVRLLARTMFCWFVKEKGLIQKELLELKEWNKTIYKLTNDIEEKSFLNNNSYYRGILQNLFFNALNKKDKKSKDDFKWTQYWNNDLDLSWFTNVPYINGGIFDSLEEDNSRGSIEDDVIKIPNFLFYGNVESLEVRRVRGARVTTVVETIERKGLNGILHSYKFTLDENTPLEEDIALDPEMLGLVFENLLAELDPNLEENTKNNIRRLTGSYYTPRKVIYEMVNDSLYLYLTKYISNNNLNIDNFKNRLNQLVYYSIYNEKDEIFERLIVEGLDKFKVLDPACGSGAFPMGMLHRIVDILKIVDSNNEKWVELKLENVDDAQKSEFKKVLTTHLDDYGRKLGIIRDSIYGIDIQPLAVQITKLRFFISLLIDQKVEKGITPMPNIKTKIICANSLKNIRPDILSDKAISQLTIACTNYYQPDSTREYRENNLKDIIDILDSSFPNFAKDITGKKVEGQNKVFLREWFSHGNIAAPFFNLDFFFPEIKKVGGFDCVIGNPPYGGSKIEETVKTELGLGSNDPYGAFIARFLNSHNIQTPLKNGGVLAFIVSDTFMTIKSHLQLRKHLMQNYVRKMLRVHPDTFKATVNTVIMIAERNTISNKIDENHICLMADLTNISIHDNYSHFVEVLNQTKGLEFENRKNISNQEHAIFYYPQSLISTNSNLPFFVASPKLFKFMNDNGKDQKKELKEIGGKQVQVRKITMNGKDIEVVKLGDIADVKVGLQTGDNDAYLFQNTSARGTYRSIYEYKDFILNEDDLEKIRNNENLRIDVIKYGISNDNQKSERYFGGRYIVPYDKGGESDSATGWLPNYFVPTNYFIDWSEWAVNRMKTLTIAQRNKINGIKGGKNKLCSRFQNFESYFKKGVTYSTAGFYAPSFRIGSGSVYGHRGTTIFTSIYDAEILLALMASKLNRYFIKNLINHTVASEAGTFYDIPSIIKLKVELSTLVKKIINIQKTNPRYDYASHEQIEIDKLVYEAYGLNTDDVQEVENWYVRRYPKLSAAQKANLRALGKSDDYLELYGLK